jgi:poly-gamma-glutamate synthesis protein (capsule biosynthesis protein)
VKGKRSGHNALLLAAILVLAVAVLWVEFGGLYQAIQESEEGAPLQEAVSSQTAPEEDDVPPSTLDAEAVSSAVPPEDTGYEISLVFAGDINLDDTWSVMTYAAQQPNGLADCIDGALLEAMNQADLCCINNEFSFSDRGTPMADKAWTFRAKPENVSLLTEMGVDVVTLANNHVYDYGADAFADTLTTLREAGIAYVGAGADLTEAATPVYKTVDGVTIAFVNATRAEKYVMTPAATEESSGVLRCYDTERFVEEIQEARAAADFVVCCVHWGTEYSYELEEVQRTTARTYLEAGADVIVGTHSHCLQGIEYYQGKPIFYSLGNFWFNDKTLETGLLRLTLTGEGEKTPSLDCTFLPAIQEGCVTRSAVTEEDRDQVLGLLRDISINAQIDDEGRVTEAAA